MCRWAGGALQTYHTAIDGRFSLLPIINQLEKVGDERKPVPIWAVRMLILMQCQLESKPASSWGQVNSLQNLSPVKLEAIPNETHWSFAAPLKGEGLS